ncbi:MAG: aromatic ring-hydroxylating dioxygenase subunit alpha [Pseudomonadota bacterium]
MTFTAKIPETPSQLLPREAYVSDDWFQQEQEELFGRSWTFAGVLGDFAEPGDYKTIKAGPHSLILVRDGAANSSAGKLGAGNLGAGELGAGNLHAFYNMCRHRGTELLEGCGNTGRSIMCPYHNWVYALDGTLRGLPAQRQCFPDLDKKEIRLFRASVGIFRDLIFVHPDAEPPEPFEDWLGGLDDVTWPHDLSSKELRESPDDIVYELKCNWKVFFENAVDGYHLAYLHKETLGGPTHDKNIWENKGRHLVWWSTERDGTRHRIPEFVEKAAGGIGYGTVKGAELPGYPGVYMIFPTTILTPNPWGFSISTMEPVDATTTLLRFRNWAPKGLLSYSYRAKDIPGYDPASGLIKSSHWTQHPLETGDFQTEDVWICEKVQRGLASPHHSVGGLARGSGGEAALDFFQQCILEAVTPK